MIDRLRTKLMKSGEHMTVGRFSYGAPKVLAFPSRGHLHVGSFCSIGDEVTIMLGGNHNTRAVSTYPFNAMFDQDGLPAHEFTKGDVVLGHDVWIGYGTAILSGVTIGDGAIVGACSVITKDVEPFTVVAGNPAAFIRNRFGGDDVTRRVQESRWWDWPIEKIREQARGLMGDAAHFDFTAAAVEEAACVGSR